MSDIEEQCLQTAPSTCSDLDQDITSQVRSLSSIDFIQRQGHAHKTTMSENPDYKGFLPGRQRPPHHHFGRSSREENTRPPPAPPLKREPSTQQWSFEMSESASGDTGSPRKEKRDIPVFSLALGSSTTGNENQVAGDDEQRNTADEDPADDRDQMPLEKPKKLHSREGKKRKSRRNKELENLAMQDVSVAQPHAQRTEPVDYASTSVQPVREPRKQSRKQRSETSLVQSTDTYTIEGRENPAFKGTEAMDNVARRRGDVQQSRAPTSSQDTIRTTKSVSEDEGEISNQVDGQVQHQSTASLMNPKCRSVHAATVHNSAMNSETRRLINQVSMMTRMMLPLLMMLMIIDNVIIHTVKLLMKDHSLEDLPLFSDHFFFSDFFPSYFRVVINEPLTKDSALF